jgi:hypothetical protein
MGLEFGSKPTKFLIANSDKGIKLLLLCKEQSNQGIDDLAWVNLRFDDPHWQPLQADQPWGAQSHPGLLGVHLLSRSAALLSTSSIRSSL